MEKQTSLTVPKLVERISEVSGLPLSKLKQLGRRLREGGHLSQHGHGRAGAAATSRDAGMLLLVAMMTSTAVNTVINAEVILKMRHPILDDNDDNLARLNFESKDPLGVVVEMIDNLRRGTKKFPELTELRVMLDGSVLLVWGELFADFRPSENEKLMKRFEKVSDRRSNGDSPIKAMVSSEGWVLEPIADWLEDREET
jgi:hypothetical protein